MLPACSGPGDAASASRTRTSSTSSADPTASPIPCFNPHGGECLGPLEAGTYQTSVFEPAIRYTVPSGWVNAEDLLGNFQLYREEDPQEGLVGGSYIGIFNDARIPDGCAEDGDPTIGNDPADLVAWYRSHDGLATSRPRRVTVGGLRGLLVDVPLRKDYRGTCPWSEGFPVVPVMIGSGVSALFHVSLHEIHVRLLVLRWKSANVTIELTSVREQHSPQEWRRLVRPIITSLEFDTGSSKADADTTG